MMDACFSQQAFRQAQLMDRMMERLRVSRSFAAGIDGGLAWHEASAKCIFCPNGQQCRDWLEAFEPLRGPAEFCPNMAFFQDCLSEILRHRAVVPTD